jgi:hypothetical protein
LGATGHGSAWTFTIYISIRRAEVLAQIDVVRLQRLHGDQFPAQVVQGDYFRFAREIPSRELTLFSAVFSVMLMGRTAPPTFGVDITARGRYRRPCIRQDLVGTGGYRASDAMAGCHEHNIKRAARQHARETPDRAPMIRFFVAS